MEILGRSIGLQCGVLLVIAVLAVPCPATAEGRGDDTKEYQIKAVFLFNFTQFVDWPAAAFPNDSAPFCIGILGDNPFGVVLEDAVRGETIQKRKFVVEHSQRLEDLKGCQMLFVSRSEEARVADILSQLGQGSVLTVGEVPGFAESGGDINFYLDGNKVRFELNPDAARSHGISMNSQLLRLGKLVGDGTDEWKQ